MVKSILLKVRPDLANTDFTYTLIKFIKEKGLELYLDPESVPEKLKVDYKITELKNAKTDCVIILGGDGTIIYT
ncbi:MAG: hypothetical protein ACTSYQ_03230, partial [Candidatus Odinarchaeia archaeon]